MKKKRFFVHRFGANIVETLFHLTYIFTILLHCVQLLLCDFLSFFLRSMAAVQGQSDPCAFIIKLYRTVDGRPAVP